MTDLAAPAGVINLYATPSELKRRLAISDTNHDLELWHLLRVASRVVDGHCGRSFYVSTESKRFDVKDRLRVNVDDLIEVTQVVEDWDGDGVYERVRSRSDLISVSIGHQPAIAERIAVSHGATRQASITLMFSDRASDVAGYGTLGIPFPYRPPRRLHRQQWLGGNKGVAVDSG